MNYESNITNASYQFKAELDAVFQAAYRFSLTLLMISCLMGCATCTNKTIESVRNSDNQWTADLNYRVCGYASGFSVSIYRSGSGPLRDGEGSKEPFQAFIRASEPYSYKQPPISIEWVCNRNLIINHNTRMSIEDSDLKLKITKANGKYQDITISYDPKPVIWE